MVSTIERQSRMIQNLLDKTDWIHTKTDWQSKEIIKLQIMMITKKDEEEEIEHNKKGHEEEKEILVTKEIVQFDLKTKVNIYP